MAEQINIQLAYTYGQFLSCLLVRLKGEKLPLQGQGLSRVIIDVPGLFMERTNERTCREKLRVLVCELTLFRAGENCNEGKTD